MRDSSQLQDHVPTIADTNIEELVLGNLLQKPKRLTDILSKVSLTPEAFHLPRTRAVYVEILRLHEEGIVPELFNIQSRLNGDCPDNYAHQLAQSSDAIDLPGYAKRLVELQEWRHRRDATLQALEAIQNRDLELYGRARANLDSEPADNTSYYTPERLASDFRQYLNSDGIEAMPLPFERLNDALGGGFRRKQFTVLGGWTSHGKSVVIDQLLTHIAREGYHTHLYMNEMGHEERVARLISSDTGVDIKEIMGGNLNLEETQRVNKALDNLPFSITPCAGWSIQELTFDIRNKDYDFVGIDILHQFDYDSEIELARISRLLTRVAKHSNCHVMATVHLNEFRANDIIKPRPVTRDIRGSGMLQRDPDNVMFIYREQDPQTGDPMTSSTLYFAKVRNGSLSHQDLMFNGSEMKFEDDQLTV